MSSTLCHVLLMLLHRRDCPFHIYYIHPQQSYDMFHTSNIFQLESLIKWVDGKVWNALSPMLFVRSVLVNDRTSSQLTYRCFESTTSLCHSTNLVSTKFNAHIDVFLRSVLRDGWQLKDVAVLGKKMTISLEFPLSISHYLKMVILTVLSYELIDSRLIG